MTKVLYGSTKSFARGNVDMSALTMGTAADRAIDGGGGGGGARGAAPRSVVSDLMRESVAGGGPGGKVSPAFLLGGGAFFKQDAMRSENELPQSSLLDDRPSPRLPFQSSGINGKGEKVYHHHPFKESVVRAAITAGFTRGEVLGAMRGMKVRGENYEDVSALLYQLERMGPVSAEALLSAGGKKKKKGGGGGGGKKGKRRPPAPPPQGAERGNSAPSRPGTSTPMWPTGEGPGPGTANGLPRYSRGGSRADQQRGGKAGGGGGGGKSGKGGKKEHNPAEIFTNQNLLHTAPIGAADVHDAFVRHCSLRVYVPSTWEGPLPPLGSEAPFEQYLAMPAGLRKVRREQEAWAAAQPWIDALHGREYHTIADLGTGMEMLDRLEAAGLPAPLAGKMVELREEMGVQRVRGNRKVIAQSYKEQRHNPPPLWKMDKAAQARAAKDVLDSAMLLPDGGDSNAWETESVLSRASTADTARFSDDDEGGQGGGGGGGGPGGGAALTRPDTRTQVRPGNAEVLQLERSMQGGRTEGGGLQQQQQQQQQQQLGRGSVSYADGQQQQRQQEQQQQEEGPSAAEQLRAKTEGKFLAQAGGWGALQRPIDELLTQASLAVCGDDQVPVWNGLQREELAIDDACDDGESAAMACGSYAGFNEGLARLVGEHAAGMGVVGNPVAVVQARHRLAAALARPHVAALKEAGFPTVRDLGTCALGEWGMPAPLVGELKRLLALVIAASSAVAPLDPARRPQPRKELFDARFQRGAYDPYGRPPRDLAALAEPLPAAAMRLEPIDTNFWAAAPGAGGAEEEKAESDDEVGPNGMPKLPPTLFGTTGDSGLALTHPKVLAPAGAGSLASTNVPGARGRARGMTQPRQVSKSGRREYVLHHSSAADCYSLAMRC
jgi:hypothetical protein